MTKRRYSRETYAFSLEALPPPKPQTLDDTRRPLSVTELAELIGWKRSKIDRYRKLGFIPYHQLGTSYKFYYLTEVLEALKNSAVPVESVLPSN